MKKQQLPEWFTGELYKEGGVVRQRFSGMKYTLTAEELSMHDFVMGVTMMQEMGMDAIPEEKRLALQEDLTKGLGWFKKNNEDAYYFLFY